jgi:SWI/SNF-related matrix-associated actin-dependent regulator 1 of chromatin subfamily A
LSSAENPFALFPYQMEGAKFLVENKQALLSHEMGLGKSCMAIIACDLVNATDILVVCPANLRINWSREFERFSKVNRPVTIIANSKTQLPPSGVSIVSYDLLVSSEALRAAYRKRKHDVLILDEAHYLKERTAKRTKAIYGHGKNPGIMHSATHTWRLSGTPMPNNPSELYTHLKSMGQEARNYWDFVAEYCDGFESNFGFKITGAKQSAIPKLRSVLGRVMLRRKKEDVALQLPKITFQEVTVPKGHVDLDPWFYENWRLLGEADVGIPLFLEQLAKQDQTLRASLLAIRDGHHFNSGDALRLIESYSKSTSTLRRWIGLAKLNACLDIIEEELASGAIDKLVIFAMHQQVIELTRVRLRKYNCVTLFGGTPVGKRQSNIDRFQNDPKTRVFIGQVVAAGVGITLTSAAEVCFLESSWVPADNAQAAMRVHRVGQKRPVRCRFFVCADTVDEQVMRVVAQKSRDITKILD